MLLLLLLLLLPGVVAPLRRIDLRGDAARGPGERGGLCSLGGDAASGSSPADVLLDGDDLNPKLPIGDKPMLARLLLLLLLPPPTASKTRVRYLVLSGAEMGLLLLLPSTSSSRTNLGGMVALRRSRGGRGGDGASRNVIGPRA